MPINRENFAKLADKLDTVPDDSERFDMTDYFAGSVSRYIKLGTVPCGTCACAAGWGPAAGIPVPPEVLHHDSNWLYWTGYISIQFFGLSIDDDDDYDEWGDEENEVYRWCFDDAWRQFDNTARGAAARIRWMLDGNPIHYKISYYAKGRYNRYRVKENTNVHQS